MGLNNRIRVEVSPGDQLSQFFSGLLGLRRFSRCEALSFKTRTVHGNHSDLPGTEGFLGCGVFSAKT